MLNFHCSICQQRFTENNTISALLCGHVYHFDCIKMWLDKKSNCPQCRSPNVGNFIKKLFFEKLSDLNDSLNISDYKSEESLKLFMEIEKFKESNNNLKEEKNNFLIELKRKSLENEELVKKLTRVEDMHKSEYLSFIHQISQRDEEIKIYKTKLDKFKFINDILNKHKCEIDMYVENLPQDDLKTQNEKLCAAIVTSKSDLDYYKENSDKISKKLVKTELKVVTLSSEIITLKKEIADLKNIDLSFQDHHNKFSETSINVIPETPVNTTKKVNLRRELSTPEILMMSTPETSSNLNDRKVFRQRMLENPFRCSPIQKPKKNTKSLLEMAIMKSHSSRQIAPNNSNIVWYKDENDDENNNQISSDEPEKKKKKGSRSKHIKPIKRN